MTVTYEKIIKLCPQARVVLAKGLADNFSSLSEKYDIKGKYIPYFIGQIAHESGRFTAIKEDLNYSVESLLSKYSRSRISESDAKRFGRSSAQRANQTAIADTIYGGEYGAKNLGNRYPGDGSKFIGRGFIQLTGRSNYERFAKHMNMSVDKVIEYLETPKGALESAMWFWNSINPKAIIDPAPTYDSAVEGLTRRINGGTNGLAERKALTRIARGLFL